LKRAKKRSVKIGKSEKKVGEFFSGSKGVDVKKTLQSKSFSVEIFSDKAREHFRQAEF
jgi:hypothetical protein